MAVYRIAELNIEINPQNERTIEYLHDYLYDSTDIDFSVSVTDEMLANERELTENPTAEWIYEATAILRVICDRIVHDYDGFFLHCSCLCMDGGAYIFTAPSGTGKSTHTRLWQETFGDRVTIINDDKPLVRKKDGAYIIYGTPWNGKHKLSHNISAPIKAVFFLEQAANNSVERVDAVTALTLLLRQTVVPTNKEDLSTLLDMLSELIEDTPMYRLRCNISRDAALTAYNAIKQ